MKSVNTYALIANRGLYSMSNWLSLTANYTRHPATSGLFLAFLMGWSIMTMIGCAWKYGRSFLDATIDANVTSYRRGYFASTVIHWPLHPIFFLNQDWTHCCLKDCKIQKKVFSLYEQAQEWRSRQVLLQVFESYFTFFSPLESLLECLEEEQALVCSFRDKPIQSYDPSRQSLNLFHSLGQYQFQDDLHFLRIGCYSSLGYHETEELSWLHSKGTFCWIEIHHVLSEHVKGFS